MAIVITGRDSKTTEATGTVTITSNSHTPSNSSLLVVAVAFINASTLLTGTFSIADNLAGHLTWTKRFYVAESNSGYTEALVVWSAPVIVGLPMTVTVSSSDGASDNHHNIHIFDVTDHDPTTPFVANSITSHAIGDAAFSMNLPSAPASTSLVVGMRSRCSNGAENSGPVTPGATFTELFDTQTPTAAYTSLQTEYRTGSTSQVVDWADVQVTGSSSGVFTSNALGFEIAVAGGAAATSMPLRRRSSRTFRQRF